MSRTKNDGDRDKRQLASSQSSDLPPSASCTNDLLSFLVKTSSSPLSVLSSDDDNDDERDDVEDKDDIDDDKLCFIRASLADKFMTATNDLISHNDGERQATTTTWEEFGSTKTASDKRQRRRRRIFV